MPISDVYEALSRGVVGGVWVAWIIMRPFRLHEVTRSHTEASLACVLFALTMNKARYLGLPEDIRTAVDDSSGIALAGRLGRLWQDDEDVGRRFAAQPGNVIFPLSETERERWKSATRPVIEAWLTRVGATGHNGEAMFAQARRLVENYGNEP